MLLFSVLLVILWSYNALNLLRTHSANRAYRPMAIDLQDTITALASPPGAAERGIVRISGPQTVAILQQFLVSPVEDWHRVRRSTRIEGWLCLEQLPVRLPVSLMLWPTSRSYTGQPMAEIHTFGSPPLLEMVLDELGRRGVRPANRGEFTMRAFLAGRIDLVQAEAVVGVIDAADHEELQTALTQLGGGITSRLSDVRGRILSLLGDLEAGLDFVEEDIEFITSRQIAERLRACSSVIRQLTDDSTTRLPSGRFPRVVLAGLPNAGKSTLFNRLAGQGKALVSPTAGTTRDYLSSVITLGKLQVELIDTAGCETAADTIQQQAQQLRNDQLRSCDLVVWCSAADLDDSDRQADEQLKSEAADNGVPLLTLTTRADLADAPQRFASVAQVSVTEDRGIDVLLRAIEGSLLQASSAKSELLATTAFRCRDALMRAGSAVDAAINAAEVSAGDEIIAMELREALHQIGVILGEVYTDDILDHIFSNFCIGK